MKTEIILGPLDKLGRNTMPGNFESLEGYTDGELATVLGLSMNTVGRWERDTGHRLLRRCSRCAGVFRYDQMNRLGLCDGCQPSAKKAGQFKFNIGTKMHAGVRAIPSPSEVTREEISAQLASDVAEFVAAGNQVTKIPNGWVE